MQILHDNRDCHFNPFQPACFSSSGSDHFNIRKITSQFSQRCSFHMSPRCLCFPAHSPFFFKDSDFLIKYHLIDEKSLHSFPPMFLSGDSQEDTNGASSSSFFVLFILRWIQFKLCQSYPFLVSNVFSCCCIS